MTLKDFPVKEIVCVKYSKSGNIFSLEDTKGNTAYFNTRGLVYHMLNEKKGLRTHYIYDDKDRLILVKDNKGNREERAYVSNKNNLVIRIISNKKEGKDETILFHKDRGEPVFSVDDGKKKWLILIPKYYKDPPPIPVEYNNEVNYSKLPNGDEKWYIRIKANLYFTEKNKKI